MSSLTLVDIRIPRDATLFARRVARLYGSRESAIQAALRVAAKLQKASQS